MGFIVGEGRTQRSLFPVALDDLIPADHVCRVLEAFVERLDLVSLGFERALAAPTGRPGYDPRDLLKLYLYGYLQQVRSSRRLESECRRNVELMWLLGRLSPDHKSIAEFRRLHSQAITQAGAALIAFAGSVGLIRGQWVAIDGSKFRAVSSAKSVGEREALAHYLAQMDHADAQDQVEIDSTAVAAALERLATHPEPEARFMRTAGGKAPAYNVQTAVDAEHALIIAQRVTDHPTDNRDLLPMAQAARQALPQAPVPLKIVADAGYSNGEHARACEEQGLQVHVPANRAINNRGDGMLLDRSAFTYDPDADRYACPGGQHLHRKQQSRRDRAVIYAADKTACSACVLKSQCTQAAQRFVTRHFDEDALQRMNQRATPQAMRIRRCTVEHPFGTLKYRIFGHPRFLMRGIRGAQAEFSIAVMAYNLKRMINILGASLLTRQLALA